MSNMVVRTNIYSINAHRNMKNVGLEQRRAANRLGSGFRINSAADDAAGLAISENMRAQIRGLDQASRNTQDGQAMLLTTEGGLEEIGNIMQRVRELLVQASNDNNTQAQRNMIEQEIAQLGEEIHGMQARVEFNTNQVLNIGRHGEIRDFIYEARVDFAAEQVIVAQASAAFHAEVGTAQVAFVEARFAARQTLATATRVATEALQANMDSIVAEVRDIPGASAAMQYMMNAARAEHQAALIIANAEFSNTMAAAGRTLNAELRTAHTALTEARNTFQAATHAFTTSLRTQFFTVSEDTIDERGVAWFQVGANSNQGITFDFTTVSQAVLVSGHLVQGIGDALVMAGSLTESGIGFGQHISPLIDAVNDGIDAINSVRANLGAVQNRMDFTMRSLDISSENLSDSESRVRNADIAREMMAFTKTNVLQQAAVSMLAQANQIPQNLLQLLR